ncbi:four-carbon acid sugar kinase family protein [Candidatus Solirubrobacter pratensis]|uniref:four-carbon acid sugar kinase family protein n=1 Tax=Candidatus Solirubrobacter pratensis TaxID=1298857 RepID=UPI0004098E3D|nr:four-carbon acid sugar kinase family protein [Candidatus Solirubrobacter pratensis]
MTAIGVLADDLTGALGSAARLKAGGLDPVVVWRPGDLREPPRAAVVDMRTRDSPLGPRRTAATWAARLRELGCARFEQRIDSTLRGAPAEELSGLLEGADLRDAPVVAVPAFPAAGRVCTGGVQAGVDVAERLFGAAAEVVRPEALRARLDAGATRLVVDGESEDDLRATAQAVDGLGVVTASPGGWLKYHPRSRGEFVLVVLGSNTELNHRQLARLNERGDARTRVVQTILGSTPDDRRRDPALADRAADEAAALLEAAHARGERCRGIVASGGHMASRLVDALDAPRLAVAGEVVPLCARGTVAGGPWSGLSVITKGGLIGTDGTLAALVDDLWKET